MSEENRVTTNTILCECGHPLNLHHRRHCVQYIAPNLKCPCERFEIQSKSEVNGQEFSGDSSSPLAQAHSRVEIPDAITHNQRAILNPIKI